MERNSKIAIELRIKDKFTQRKSKMSLRNEISAIVKEQKISYTCICALYQLIRDQESVTNRLFIHRNNFISIIYHHNTIYPIKWIQKFMTIGKEVQRLRIEVWIIKIVVDMKRIYCNDVKELKV